MSPVSRHAVSVDGCGDSGAASVVGCPNSGSWSGGTVQQEAVREPVQEPATFERARLLPGMGVYLGETVRPDRPQKRAGYESGNRSFAFTELSSYCAVRACTLHRNERQEARSDDRALRHDCLKRDVPMVVEVAGIEPASADGKPGLLRVQCAMDFLGPSARTHTSTDRPSRVRVPGNPHDKGAQQAF